MDARIEAATQSCWMMEGIRARLGHLRLLGVENLAATDTAQ
jgi:hypothetical protein